MASPVSLLLLFLSFLFGALTTATARPGLPFHPCKTLLVSTYSVSFKPRSLPDDAPNHIPLDGGPHRRPEFFAVVAEVRDFDLKPHRFFLGGPRFFPDRPEFHPHPRPEGFMRDETLIRRPGSDLPLGSSSSSLRDRTIDVLNVLASLLFGAACGALTAGTMFLIWSLFNSRLEGYQRSVDGFSDDDGDDNDDDEDIFNPKKENNNNSKVVAAVPAPPSVTDSADTALLKKESA